MHKIQEIFNNTTIEMLSKEQQKAFNSIKKCRTAALGAHVDACPSCKNVEISYNSCRNRHCPLCSSSKQHEWVENQMPKLLPIGYFHLVFTIPHEFNTLVLQNQSLMYSILMKSVGETIKECAANPKYLGAQVGATTVLHTWGQNLSYHPHVHCIVPGGGLSESGIEFIQSGKRFFVPIKVLSKKFRGKFLYHVKEAWKSRKIELFNDAVELGFNNNFYDFIDKLYSKNWVVYCKKPFKTPEHVLRYLGRYTHRVAISDSRIQKFNGETVTFAYKDYRSINAPDNNSIKQMTLTKEEFVRRFLLHVLPSGFTKIRHYGILASKNIREKLALCFKLIGIQFVLPKVVKYILECPHCGCEMKHMGSIKLNFASS